MFSDTPIHISQGFTVYKYLQTQERKLGALLTARLRSAGREVGRAEALCGETCPSSLSRNLTTSQVGGFTTNPGG